MEYMVGAIVITGFKSQVSKADLGAGYSAIGVADAFSDSLASIPVLGCSTIARTVESIRHAGINDVSVFGQTRHGSSSSGITRVCLDEEEAWGWAARQLRAHREKGFDAVLVVRGGSYIECEYSSLLEQHRQHGESVTRAFDQEGPLDLWIVDPRNESENLLAELQNVDSINVSIGGYVNRLQDVYDLRRLATDILTLRCRVRPAGVEVRPNLWIAEGAQVARSARLVAPAYIGTAVKIEDDCLITRCSNVEANSYIDFGTAVEDSSILPETYVGIGLDLSHSVVDGGEILNLHHDVRLLISDPVVLRRSATRAHNAESVSQTKEMAFPSN